ncbi:MAG TPA: MlaA family lipoprotein [Candidatus Azoamicus sp. OHIO2]
MKKLYLLLLIYLFVELNTKIYTLTTDLEYINRRIYNLNRGIDYFFYNPTINLYTKLLPSSFKSNLNNFFTNIENIEDIFFNIIFTNEAYNKKKIIKELINTSLDCFGLVDNTKILNLITFNLSVKTDILQNKFYSKYLILPILGPGTIKTHCFLILHQFWNPLIYFNKNIFIYYFLYIINKKTTLIYDINFFHTSILDGYSFLKSVFLQNNFKTTNKNDFLTEPS